MMASAHNPSIERPNAPTLMGPPTGLRRMIFDYVRSEEVRIIMIITGRRRQIFRLIPKTLFFHLRLLLRVETCKRDVDHPRVLACRVWQPQTKSVRFDRHQMYNVPEDDNTRLAFDLTHNRPYSRLFLRAGAGWDGTNVGGEHVHFDLPSGPRSDRGRKLHGCSTWRSGIEGFW